MVIGIDVGARRLHCVAVDEDGSVVDARVFAASEPDALTQWSATATAIAIDAPAELSTAPHAADATLSPKFRHARCAEIALGREHGTWVPWTSPTSPPIPGWMATGFELFRAAGARQRLDALRQAGLRIGDDRTSHDLIDAALAALIALQHTNDNAVPVTCGHDDSTIWLPQLRRSSNWHARSRAGILGAVGIFDVLPRTAETRDGRLTIGGVALADVAAEFGTPAFVVDERGLRETARDYLDAFTSRHANTDVHFASKALPCAPITRILAEEGLGCDVASAGELAIALAAGFDPEHILLHGNAKSDLDIGDALNAGVGVIVIDGSDDVDRLEKLTTKTQRVLLRVNPAVPGETHAAMDTGSPEAKFGVALEEAPALIERIESTETLELLGLHVHIGSQLLDLDGFGKAAEALAALGRFPVYDLGGGLGIAYRPEDRAPSIADYADATVKALHEHLDPEAQLIVEPGRSVVGRSMVTLYEVITVKRGRLTHVAVNGGMGDNLEPMLYGQRFAPFILDGQRPRETCELVGHHCESGDVLERGVELATPEVGDRLVMPVTGAYCYSLSNNYNGARRPPVVLCRDGEAKLAVRRETFDDLLARNVA